MLSPSCCPKQGHPWGQSGLHIAHGGARATAGMSSKGQIFRLEVLEQLLLGARGSLGLAPATWAAGPACPHFRQKTVVPVHQAGSHARAGLLPAPLAHTTNPVLPAKPRAAPTLPGSSNLNHFGAIPGSCPPLCAALLFRPAAPRAPNALSELTLSLPCSWHCLLQNTLVAIHTSWPWASLLPGFVLPVRSPAAVCASVLVHDPPASCCVRAADGTVCACSGRGMGHCGPLCPVTLVAPSSAAFAVPPAWAPFRPVSQKEASL